MGEAASSLCPLCGRSVAAAAGPGPAGVVCVCGSPIAFALTRVELPKPPEKPAEKPFDPGAAIPPAIRAGLIEIHASIKEKRNPKGGRALCWDVLDQMLDYCRQTWPPPPKSHSPAAPIAGKAAVSGATAGVGVSASLFVSWKLGLTSQITGTLCGSCASPNHLSVGLVVIVLLSVVLTASFSAGFQLVKRAALAEGTLLHPGHGGVHASVRLGRLEALRTQGVITKDLFTWGREVGLDEPPKLKFGEPPPLHPPPLPPPADHPGVQLLGAFVLAMADQVFEAPRKLAEARTGRWP